MEQPKRKQATPTKNGNSSGFEMYLLGEDGWVMVKKQKVTILIPPLPVTTKPLIPEPGPHLLLSRPRITTELPSQSPTRTQPEVLSEKEKSLLLNPEKAIAVVGIDPSSQPILTHSKPPKLDRKTCSKNPQVNRCGYRQTPGVCSTMRVCKSSHRVLDGQLLMNKKMRASNLERKLQRAGGLSSWLASLGLYQFIKIFRGKGVNKFQLLNLTMKKLKDMGAEAVGPRRKLIHAIDCLCQPYCFETK